MSEWDLVGSGVQDQQAASCSTVSVPVQDPPKSPKKKKTGTWQVVPASLRFSTAANRRWKGEEQLVRPVASVLPPRSNRFVELDKVLPPPQPKPKHK